MDIVRRRAQIVGCLTLFLALNIIFSRIIIFDRFKQVVGLIFILQFVFLVIRFKKGYKFVSFIIPILLFLIGFVLFTLGILSFIRDDRGDGALILGILGLYVFVLSFASHRFTKALIRVNLPDFKSKYMTRAQHSMELLYGSTVVLMSLSAYAFKAPIMTQGLLSVTIMVAITIFIFILIYMIFTKILKKDIDPMMLTMMSYILFTVIYALSRQLFAFIPLMLAAFLIATYLFVFHPEIKGDYKIEESQ
jgi:hypothetical protein